MKTVIYYHILMVNEWERIVKDQLRLIYNSGLYDEVETIKIGALGMGISKLKEIISVYPKCEIVRHNVDITKYEFWTLRIAHEDAKSEKPFYGLYLHTKGVSYPNHPGGKYWRDYMGYYNVVKWKEAVKQLRKGFDTCGVKLTAGRFPLHYSGNFFWFKSSYLKRLKDPCSCNIKDRFEAEFWSCTGDPKAATLCQDFVDYNTKGSFYKGENYVHTLAYNLPSEVEKATKLLYDLNDNFEHYIVDLGYPVVKAGEVPEDINKAKQINTDRLSKIAQRYGSEYIKLPNVGVSQNWEAVWRELDMCDDDVLIGADPDEHPLNEGWVDATGDVLRSGYGLVSLMMTDHKPLLAGKRTHKVAGHRCMNVEGGINWALIGMSGKLLSDMGGVPVPKGADRYGWIEAAVKEKMDQLDHKWTVLVDYMVRHTDYQLGDKGTDSLLREWKNLIIFQIKRYGQISFDEYLKRKANGEFN